MYMYVRRVPSSVAPTDYVRQARVGGRRSYCQLCTELCLTVDRGSSRRSDTARGKCVRSSTTYESNLATTVLDLVRRARARAGRYMYPRTGAVPASATPLR